jgi:hypothetical protein
VRGGAKSTRWRDALGRDQPLTAASLKPGAVQSGTPPGRARADPVGHARDDPRLRPVAVEIRGERFEVGDPFTQVIGIAGRRLEYSRIIERREELKELKWHCPTTGGFQHWLLTDAQGGTFVDMEMGMNPPALRYGLFDKTMGRWVIKRWSEQAVDGLRKTLA